MTAPSQPPSIDVDHLRGWIGRTETREDIATAAKSQTLAATLDYDADPWGGQLFPLAHWTHFNPIAAQHELDADGHPRLGGFLPPVPLPRRMWAGSEITFHQPIRLGQTLQEVQTVTDVTHRTGRSGELVFVTVSHEIYADDSLATTDLHTIVYREAAAPAAGNRAASSPSAGDPSAASAGSEAVAESPADRASQPAPDVSAWDYAATTATDERLLFRYSALTFNAHRIHYDREFCRRVEGYPGLVVHGPLIATLIMDAFMRARPGEQVRGFSFTARRPIFDGTPVTCVGRRTTASATETCALDPAGNACISGTIHH